MGFEPACSRMLGLNICKDLFLSQLDNSISYIEIMRNIRPGAIIFENLHTVACLD